MSYSDCNSHISSCMYSSEFAKHEDPWSDQLYSARISQTDEEFSKEMKRASNKQPLREKNRKNSVYRHVPHKDKPPQVVARRNARERRRVQAVNTAFVRLRKAVPIENTRGKRISKVKTLQNAIEYIRALQKILQNQGNYGSNYEIFQNKYIQCKYGGYLDNVDFEDF